MFKLADEGKEKKSGNKVSKFVIQDNGLLYREVKAKLARGDEYTTQQLVVPEVYRSMVFKLAHSSLLGGHQGGSKTLSKIQKYFFWPSMSAEVLRWAMSCDICQRTTDKGRVKPAPLVNLPVISPLPVKPGGL